MPDSEAVIDGPTGKELVESVVGMTSKPQEALRSLQTQQAASMIEPGRRIVNDLGISASYHQLRWGMALLAFAFPLLLIWQGSGLDLDRIQSSLSAYYHYSIESPTTYGTGHARNIFVGVLCAIGAFLWFYKGYGFWEDWALNLAGVTAVMIAFFPMDWPSDVKPPLPLTATGSLHQGSATIFFLLLLFVCLFCSRTTLDMMKAPRTRQAFKRWYRWISAVFAAVPGGILLAHFWFKVGNPKWLLLVEWIGIYAFAVFWCVKTIEIWKIEHEGSKTRVVSHSRSGMPGINASV